MSKQVYWFGGTIVFVIIVLIGSVLFLRKGQVPEYDVYNAIPTDATLVVETSMVQSFLTESRRENSLWKELQNMPALAELDASLGELVPLLEEMPEVYNRLDGSMVFSGHKTGRDKLSFLAYMKIRQRKQMITIDKAISENLLGVKDVTIRNYEGVELKKIVFQDTLAQKPVYYCFVNGIGVWGYAPYLVESVIRQCELDSSLKDDKAFSEVYNTSGKNVFANVYVNLESLPEVASSLLAEDYGKKLQSQPVLSNWVELDLNLKDNALLFNGFSSTNDSAGNYLGLFLQQEPVENTCIRVLPATTSAFFSLGVEDFVSFQEGYYKFLGVAKRAEAHVKYFTKVNRKYQVDFEGLFKQLTYKEVACGYADLDNNSPEDEAFVLVRVQSQATAKEKLLRVLQKIPGETGGCKKSTIRIDEETVFDVVQLPVGDLFGSIFGQFFSCGDFRYVAFYDNYMLVAQSREQLFKLLHYNVLGKTLDKDPRFEEFSDYLSSKSNIFVYANLYRAPDVLGRFLSETLEEGLVKNAEVFRKFQGVALQVRKSNDMLFNNLFVKYTPEFKEEAHTVWESHLDTLIDFKPQLVENHYSKEQEIFVQDLKHKVYLINKVGRVLWKLQLDEPILGPVYQVDYYKNGKLQLIFNTATQIHLLDRNGNYVERYPVTLRAKATTGLALFDYDNNRNYRIFVPTADKQVYLYNADGSINTGWDFSGSDAIVHHPVQHFKIGTKDYIVFHDKFRTYILNRRGETRVAIKEQFPVAQNNHFYYYNKNGLRGFVTTDTSGIVQIISEKGEVHSKSLGRFSAGHFFQYQDMDADASGDYIFVDDDELVVYKENGKELFDYEFEFPVVEAPSYYYFSYNNRKLGVADRKAGKIYLFESDGDQYAGFPLRGSTPFTIGYLGNDHKNFNLLVGTKENFLYNYTVQ